MGLDPDPALMLMAQEELDQACTLGWAALARVTPWGDAYDGYAPGGRAVRIERNYIWKSQAGGDILVEISVFPGESRRDRAGQVSRVIPKA